MGDSRGHKKLQTASSDSLKLRVYKCFSKKKKKSVKSSVLGYFIVDREMYLISARNFLKYLELPTYP